MKILSSVPSMMWGIDKEITFVQALEGCLLTMGVDADYDELACASGMAFSFKWKRESPCPSAGTIDDQLYIDRLFKFIGRDYKVVWENDSGFNNAVMESLQAEKPVIVQGGFNVPDYYILAGFDLGENKYFGRTPFDSTDDYAITTEKPMRAIIIGDETGEKMEGMHKLYYPLHSALLAYDRTPPSDGHESNYEHSFEGYDQWIKHLTTDEFWDGSDPQKLDLYVHANEWVFDVLYTSRLAAGRYLIRTANFHHRKDAQHIMQAGRMFYVIASILHQRGFAAFGVGQPEKGYPKKYLTDSKTRLEWAHHIRMAAEQDRKGYEEIKAVLGANE